MHCVQTSLPHMCLLLCIVKPVSRIAVVSQVLRQLLRGSFALHNFIRISRITALEIKIDVNGQRDQPLGFLLLPFIGCWLDCVYFTRFPSRNPAGARRKMLLFSWFVLSCISLRLGFRKFPTATTKPSPSKNANQCHLSQIPVYRFCGPSSQHFTSLAYYHQHLLSAFCHLSWIDDPTAMYLWSTPAHCISQQ